MQKHVKPEFIVAVTSYTGKTGKSTTGNNLLYPRMKNPMMFRVETINESGLSGAGENEQKFKGRDIEKLFMALSKTDSAIVDVGTSNVEAFFLALAQQSGSHQIFDYFVIPVEANSAKVNEFKEAIKTIKMLEKLGVPPDRIKVVFNKLAPDSEIRDEMSRIFNFHSQFPIFTINENAVIHETQAFKALADSKMSYGTILADTANYMSILKNTPLTEEVERTRLVRMARTQGLIQELNTELNIVFDALFGGNSKSIKTTLIEADIDASTFD